MKYGYIFTLVVLSSNLHAQVGTDANAVSRANRRLDVKSVRAVTNNLNAAQLLEIQESNGDEQRFADKRGNFFKSLKIQDNGLVDLEAYEQMIAALISGSPELFNAITMGTNPVQRRLVDPQAAFAYNLDGKDGWIFTMPPAPSVTSAESAGEMVEVYWHALLRDVPFNEYGTNVLAAQAIADLNALRVFKGPKIGGQVTAQTLFRGNVPGTLVGPLVSQFLYLPVPYGSPQNTDGGPGGTPGIDFQAQVVPTSSVSNDFGTDFNAWLAMQRGQNPTSSITFTTDRLFIRNARDLGDYVHYDAPPQEYINAANILLGFKGDALDRNNPYIKNPTQEAFVTYGLPDILYLVNVAVEMALRAAWYQKWLVNRRLRPEYFAFLVNQQKTGIQNFGINDAVINSQAVSVLFGMNGNYFLPLAYPEGSPTHPSYPAGHATVAGAAATILKAFFNEDFIIPSPLQPNAANIMLEPYTGTPLTVGGELNKLAANVALGRDYAGVHYRSDGYQGIVLGEKVAIAVLQDEAYTRHIPFNGFSLTKFDGTRISVGAKKDATSVF